MGNDGSKQETIMQKNVVQQESMLSCIEKSSEQQVATIVHTMPNPEWLEQFNVVQ